MMTADYEEDDGEDYDYEEDDGEENVDLMEKKSKDQCRWKIPKTESTYDLSLLRTVRIGEKVQTKGVTCHLCVAIVKLLFLIYFNVILQGIVIYRVRQLVNLTRSNRLDSVFAPSGNCKIDSQSKISTLHLFGTSTVGHQPENWNCGPMWPMLMSNVSIVDANRDGVWSSADGLEEMSAYYSKEFQKDGNLQNIFEGFLDSIRKGEFVYQKINKLTDDQTREQTDGFTKIPMEWMRMEEPRIQLCNNADTNLCANFEARGILEPRLNQSHHWMGQDWKNKPRYRVAACEELTQNWCYEVFGELWRSYTEYAASTCGEVSPHWITDPYYIVAHRYEQADKYNPRVDSRSILSASYINFLLFILIIWWLIVIKEVRACLAWWGTIWNIDGSTTLITGGKADNPEITITAIRFVEKLFIGINIVLPRTLIILSLAYIGTDFLIIADDYADLILNSVALGFLVDVDDMLFAAVVSEEDKDAINNLQDIEAEPTDCCAHYCCLAISAHTWFTLVLFVLAMALAQVGMAYGFPHGKEDLSSAFECICHVEGPKCMGAQILGGKMMTP